MNYIYVAAMLLVGAVGGAIGWRRSTRYIYRRSVKEPVLPAGVTRREYDREIRRRRKIRRLFVTLLYSLVGAVLGAAVLIVSRR